MDFFEYMSGVFKDLANSFLDLLPTSPIVFLSSNSTISKYLSWVNWFIPVYTWIAILENWLVAIGIYYVVQVVLRWLKIID